jgi:Asp-tRNA(Asn)/Glu-tRNA(Gln) amidotransferase C subunit
LTQALVEVAQRLGGLSLSQAELEAIAPQLETLLSDIRMLEALDLGEVEPETLFDMQGE